MRASIPAPENDRPRLASTALVAVAMLALGLFIARWTVRPAPPEAVLDGMGAPDGTSERAGDDATGDGAEPALDDAPGPLDGTPSDGPTGEPPSTPAAPEPEAEPEPTAAAAVPTDRGEPTPGARGEPTTLPARGPERGTLVRGRVAYLRCEGGASGAGCARDRAIEDAIWSAIETLPTCAGAPSPGGQADLVVGLTDDGVEVRTRDTFGADVARLDGEAVRACVAHLESDPSLVASSRRALLSFRFTLAP